jgi:hypothetical protein
MTASSSLGGPSATSSLRPKPAPPRSRHPPATGTRERNPVANADQSKLPATRTVCRRRSGLLEQRRPARVEPARAARSGRGRTELVRAGPTSGRRLTWPGVPCDCDPVCRSGGDCATRGGGGRRAGRDWCGGARRGWSWPVIAARGGDGLQVGFDVGGGGGSGAVAVAGVGAGDAVPEVALTGNERCSRHVEFLPAAVIVGGRSAGAVDEVASGRGAPSGPPAFGRIDGIGVWRAAPGRCGVPRQTRWTPTALSHSPPLQAHESLCRAGRRPVVVARFGGRPSAR